MNRQLASATISLVALAGLTLTSPAIAQNWPFSKAGMRRLNWGPGSTLTLGSTDSGAAAIALDFAYDDAFGVKLTSIGHRGTQADGTVSVFAYDTTPPVGEPTALWKAVFRPVESDTPFELLPPPGSLCRVFANHRTSPRSVIFQWAGAELPDPLADSLFWMELRADIDEEEPWRVEWRSRLGRLQHPGNPNRYTLDEVHAPILYAKAPGTGALERILVPIAGATALPAANLRMGLWAFFGFDMEFEHPARDQQLQFSAMYCGDPFLPSHRKLLYLATEDHDGYYKQFRHRVIADNPFQPAALTYRWAPAYFPTYGPTPWINYHASAYPAVFEALQAQSDSFWYDCTERYRRFVDQEMGLTRIADPAYALNPDFPRAAPFVANSVIEALPEAPLPTLYPPYTAHALRLREVFDGADGRDLPTFMEWQKWLKGDPINSPSPGRPPEDPIGPGYNPKPYSGAYEALGEAPQYVLDEIAVANQAGINASVYTSPLVINRDDWPSFPDEWLLRQRDGSYWPVGAGATGNIVDFGNPGVPEWMAGVLYDDILDTAPGLGGVFFDVISGGGSYLRYPSDPEYLFRMRRYHGGTAFVRGTQRTFDLVRERIAAEKPTAVHPDVPFIPAETVQEFLAGRYDFGQQGLKSFPMQMQFNTALDMLLLNPVYWPFLRAESSNPSPPLWNAVYHEWSRAEGLTVMLSVLGVDPGIIDGQVGPPVFGGLSWERWGDYMRFVHALWWVHGSKPTSFQYYSGYEGYDLLVDAPGGGVTVRDPQIVQQQQAVDFLRRLHHSLDRFDEAGKFLSTGQLERPLQTPDALDPLRVWQSTNPSADVAALAFPSGPGVLHFYENFFSTQPYNVPHVFHSVWRSVETGELGIVFVNWSDGPAWWHGTFDPRLYEGFESGVFTVYGVAPTGAGVTEYVVGQGAGPTELAWPLFGTAGIALRHHASVPGMMPPRSVQVFVVRPQ